MNGLLPDHEIRKLVEEWDMLDPFTESLKEEGIISYGLSSYGYDIRASEDFKVFVSGKGSQTLVDPKNFTQDFLVDHKGSSCVIPPNSFVLARSVERFKMPYDVMGICLGKSTYARCGLVVNTTPLEAGWEGFLTIELSNTTPIPLKVYANEGIAQVLFFRGESQCSTDYGLRGGKYQNQKAEVTLPKIQDLKKT